MTDGFRATGDEIRPEDCAEVVRVLLLRLSPRARIPLVELRAGTRS